jgi:ADP-ribosylglycohydrolase
MERDRRSCIRGALLGGAIGDALGAPVEFMSLREIRERVGPSGVTHYLPAYGLEAGAITDDTQMTLFTAEGLLRALVRATHRGVVDTVAVVQRAYWRWLSTQEASWPDGSGAGQAIQSGWLVMQEPLHVRRAPGLTCLSALGTGRSGSVDQPINDSKGCGAVMRSAPFGLAGITFPPPFDLAVACGALTHGNPSAYLPAGVLAAVIDSLAAGVAIDDSLDAASVELRRHDGHEETLRAIEQARLQAARSGDPSPDRVEALGAGWMGHEALAIAVYCALVASDLRSALLLAVNHSGDSDSTGSITGNLLGAALGEPALPGDLLASLELRQLITRVADDLADGFFGQAVGHESEPTTPEIDEFLGRYPGW